MTLGWSVKMAIRIAGQAPAVWFWLTPHRDICVHRDMRKPAFDSASRLVTERDELVRAGLIEYLPRRFRTRFIGRPAAGADPMSEPTAGFRPFSRYFCGLLK